MDELTQDIIRYELQDVQDAQGNIYQAMLPKVYIISRQGDVVPNGALISANELHFNGDKDIRNTGTIAARQAAVFNAINIKNSGSIVGQSVLLDASNKIDVTGKIQAQQLLSLKADVVNVTSTTTTSGDKLNGSTKVQQVAQLSVSNDEGKAGTLSIDSQKDVNLKAAKITNSTENGFSQVISRHGNVNVDTVKTEKHTAYGDINDKSHRHVHTTEEVGTSIDTNGDLLISADKQLTVRQGDINSESGNVSLNGKQGVQITEGRKTLDLDEAVYNKSKGLLSSKTKKYNYEKHHDTASASTVTGKKVAIKSDKDVLVRGSIIISDDETLIAAKNNVNIDAAVNSYYDNEKHSTKKSGLMGAGIGFTIGSKKQATDNKDTNTVYSGSDVGSLKGDTTIIAGNKYTQTASDLSTPQGDINVLAKSIDVKAATNNYTNDNRYKYEQKGLTLSVNVPIISAIQSTLDSTKQIGKSKHTRVNAMATANAADDAYGAYQGYQGAKDALGSLAKGNIKDAANSANISVSLSYGQQKNTSTSHSKTTEAKASKIRAGGQLNLIATGADKDSNINISGSDVAGQAATNLFADNQVNIQAAEQSLTKHSNNKSSGFNAGVSVSIGVDGPSYGFTVGGNKGKGHANVDEVSYRNSHVGSKTGNTNVQSGGATDIKGGQLLGKAVGIDAAELNVQSLQDTAKYDSKQKNISAQVTGGAGVSASGSFDKSSANADYASVNEQSGVFAEDGGSQINVKGKTKLIGGAIVSTADKAKNHLTSKEFEYSDIKNHANVDASSMGLAGGLSINKDQTSQEDKDLDKKLRKKGETYNAANPNQQNSSPIKFGLGGNDVHSADKYAAAKIIGANLLSNGKESQSNSNVTASVISDGNFNIASQTGKQNLENIQKAKTTAHQALAKIDKDGVIEQSQLTQKITQKFINQTVMPFVDEGYRSQFIAEHRMMTFAEDENGKPIVDNDRLKIEAEKLNMSVKEYTNEQKKLGNNIHVLREVSDNERKQLKQAEYVDPNTGKRKSNVAVMVNGIFNDLNDAAKYAVQNYIADKSIDTGALDQPIYKNIYFVHNPKANNIISENLVAGYQKFLEGNIGSLGNSTRQIKTIMQDYGNKGLYVGSHSRGTLTVANALSSLAKDKNNIDTAILSKTDMKMVGAATNEKSADDRLAKLQGFKNGRPDGDRSIRVETHKYDFVPRLIGNNPATIDTHRKDIGIPGMVLDTMNSGPSKTSPHNVYGLGNRQGVKDGYRTDTIMHKENNIFDLNRGILINETDTNQGDK